MLCSIDPARLIYSPDGTPVSETYGDVYHSSAGGHDQARHVFLSGNGLPERWRGRESFSILETGFGLGLNFLATWLEWRSDPERSDSLQFISVEKHPFSASELSSPGATLATWSVAGHVRQSLAAAGFVVEKRPGFASKRQMLVGRYVG